MILEDYVSFEVAKLLKEKGFDEFNYYGWDEQLFDKEHPRSFSLGFDSKEHWISCPTHQTAMKWLRGKGIHMSIDTVISSSGNIYFNIDTYSEDSGWNHPVDFYNSYEEAVEAALKYCLENLI